jgi:hypothetical protein
MNKIGKYGLTIVAVLLLTVFASATVWAAGEGAALQKGGDRLVGIQCSDGGWGWPLNCAGASPVNTIGPIGMGLAQAYKFSSDPTMLTALTNAGTILLAKTNNFSPSDGYLAVQLDRIFGGTTYRDRVWNYFYAPLALGTYNRNGAGTLYSTASYVALIITSRGASQKNLAAWDMGMGLVAAASMGASTSEWVKGVETTIDTLAYANTDYYWEPIGLAGAVYGLAFAGEDYTALAGDYSGMNLMGMANALAAYQMNTGGFSWDAHDILTPGNEDVQTTAYAILALNEVKRPLYSANIFSASDFLVSDQLGTGGWDIYGENNELTGEALWAMSAAASSLMDNMVGPQGPAGATGPTGSAGADGAQGATGATGSQGIPGIQGIQGVQGVQGPVGPTGAQGQAGTSSWTDGSDSVSAAVSRVGIGTSNPWSAFHVAELNGSNNNRGIIISQHDNSRYAAVLQLERSRGTLDNSTALVNGDSIGAMHFQGYDGSSYLRAASIKSTVEGSITAGSIPTSLSFETGTGNTNTIERIKINSSGKVLVNDLKGTYSGGSAYVCVNNNGQLFTSETGCP